MSDVVVDANVAVKWIIDEPFSDQAQQLFLDTTLAHDRLIEPPMLTCEVVSVIYQRRRSQDQSRNISDADAEAALSAFLALPIVTMAPPGLFEEAFRFARNHGLTNAYDSLSVVLAEMLDINMWTDDQTLLKALGSTTPRLRAIGDYPMPSPA